MKINWLLLGLMLSLSAYAHDVRNGGAAVVCYKADGKTIESVELFDYWESKKILSTTIDVDLGPESLSVVEKIKLFTERLEVVDPYRADRYRTAGLAIVSQLGDVLRSGLGSKPIDDDASTIQPQDPCKKELFAVQIREPNPGQPRFMIRKELYEHPRVSNSDRAGIILHEVIYRDVIEDGAENSSGARYYNYLVASKFQRFLDDIDTYSRHVVFANGFIFKRIRPMRLPGISDVFLLKDDVGNDEQMRTLAIKSGTLHVSKPIVTETIQISGVTKISYRNPGCMNFETCLRLSFWQDDLPKLIFKTKVLGSWIQVIPQDKEYEFEFLRNKDEHSETPWQLTRSLKFLGQIDIARSDGLKYSCEKAFEMSPRTFSRKPEDRFLDRCEVTSSFSYHLKDGTLVESLAGMYSAFGYDKDRNEALLAIHLAKPAKLQIWGTEISKAFQGEVVLDKKGSEKIQLGTSFEPIFVDIGGRAHPVFNLHVLEYEPGTTHLYKLVLPFESPRIQGLPVRVDGIESRRVGLEFCDLQGPVGTAPVNLLARELSTVSRYVQKQESFYDLKRRAIFLATSEHVDVLQQVKCFANYVTLKILDQ